MNRCSCWIAPKRLVLVSSIHSSKRRSSPTINQRGPHHQRSAFLTGSKISSMGGIGISARSAIEPYHQPTRATSSAISVSHGSKVSSLTNEGRGSALPCVILLRQFGYGVTFNNSLKVPRSKATTRPDAKQTGTHSARWNRGGVETNEPVTSHPKVI